MAAKMILVVILAAFLSTRIVHADVAGIDIGSRVKVEDATAKSDVVLVGRIARISDIVGTYPFERRDATVTVLSVLRGSAGPHIVVRMTTDYADFPFAGWSYIFFIQKSADQNNAIKLISVISIDDDQIAGVKKLISQLPAK